jgi:hypothetical protein
LVSVGGILLQPTYIPSSQLWYGHPILPQPFAPLHPLVFAMDENTLRNTYEQNLQLAGALAEYQSILQKIIVIKQLLKFPTNNYQTTVSGLE